MNTIDFKRVKFLLAGYGIDTEKRVMKNINTARGWVKISRAAEYAGVSVRTIRKWLRMGLRHSRIPGGSILISYDAVDEFIQEYEAQDNVIDKIVDEIMKGLPSK